MNRILAVTFILSFSGATVARETYEFEEDRGRPGQEEMIQETRQQKMEEGPSSTTVGGSRGGQLEMEKKRDDLRNKQTQEGRRLFENRGLYRRGF